MKILQLKVLFLIATLCVCQHLSSQKYNEYAQKVREEVWAWDIPEFQNYTTPDEYKNESAVILAMHDRMIATGKSRFRINMELAFGINKELVYSITHRALIKINDKVSLEKYSSISFREQKKVSGYMMSSKFKTIVGARIIKPDGTIREVDIENESVAMTEGKKEKVDHKKIAIPDLQVGDILDYFIQDEGHVDTQNIPPQNFIFGSQYPISYYSIHCEIGDKLTVEYRPVNGAPDFSVSTNKNDDVILDVEKKNIPKIEGLGRWVSKYREFPMIRISILNNASGDIWKPKTARKKGLYKNIAPTTIFDDAKCAYGNDKYANWGVEKDVKKMVDKYKKENPNCTNEDLAAYIYDALQYKGDYQNHRSPQWAFISTLNGLLRFYKIDYKLGLATGRYGARAEEVANRLDINYFSIVNGQKQIFTYNSPFNIAGEVDYDLEGEKAITYANYKYKGKIVQGTEGSFLVPVTDEKYNSSLNEINVNFTNDPLVLEIDRKVIRKGNLKSDFQFEFVTYDQWDQEMRARLGINKTMTEEMSEKRSSRKYVDDYNAAVEEAKRKQKDKFKLEINQYHGSDPRNIIDHNVEHLGITPQNPDFTSTVKYEMEGLVQRAGNNYILNVGKLIGEQLDLKGNDRKRNLDIYMPTARSYEYKISIKIPDGYAVSDVHKLNKSTDNVAGSFKVTATLDGQILNITARKVYKNAFEPMSNWDKLLEMLDSTVDFCSQSVVLRIMNSK